MDDAIFDHGVTLMLVGMGTVFSFLGVLVIAMSLMSAVIRKLTPAVVPPGASAEEVAAITAAIAKHRQK